MKNLTPELKAYYMADFEQNVLNCDDDFWQLDYGLKDLLININRSPNIQTLYSRKRNDKNDTNIYSFLWILISEDVSDAKVNNFIRDAKSKLYDFSCQPVKRITQNKEKHIKMNCINDSKYFKNGAIMIQVVTPEQNEHHVFWKLIKKHLTKF